MLNVKWNYAVISLVFSGNCYREYQVYKFKTSSIV